MWRPKIGLGLANTQERSSSFGSGREWAGEGGGVAEELKKLPRVKKNHLRKVMPPFCQISFDELPIHAENSS